MVPPTPKRTPSISSDDVESNRGSLENVAETFVLFLCGVQLVLRSGVFTKLDLDEVDVTPRFAEVFRSGLSGVGGSTGGWRCRRAAPSLPQLPPATPKNPPPYISLLFFWGFCSDRINQHKIWAAGGISVFIWEAGWKEPFGNNSQFAVFSWCAADSESCWVIIVHVLLVFAELPVIRFFCGYWASEQRGGFFHFWEMAQQRATARDCNLK